MDNLSCCIYLIVLVLNSLLSVFKLDELLPFDSPLVVFKLVAPFLLRNRLAKFSLINLILCVCSVFLWNFFSLVFIVLRKVAVVRLADLKFLWLLLETRLVIEFLASLLLTLL